jgi:hypothetical protein
VVAASLGEDLEPFNWLAFQAAIPRMCEAFGMMLMNQTCLCVALLGVYNLASAASGDWPQWRGPNHDNISTETGLLKEWPEGGPKLVWEVKDLGHGFGSVSTFGERLFTSGDKDGASFIEARNPADGKAIWNPA